MVSARERPYPPRMYQDSKGYGYLYHMWRNKWRKIGHVSDPDAAFENYRDLERRLVETDPKSRPRLTAKSKEYWLERMATRRREWEQKQARQTGGNGRQAPVPQERELLALFRSLDATDRSRLLETAEQLHRLQAATRRLAPKPVRERPAPPPGRQAVPSEPPAPPVGRQPMPPEMPAPASPAPAWRGYYGGGTPAP